jgi:hypothetical protein
MSSLIYKDALHADKIEAKAIWSKAAWRFIADISIDDKFF